MIPISQFYLGATPNSPLSSAPFTRPQSMSQVSLQRSSTRGAASPPEAAPVGPGNRASMPPQRRPAAQSEASASSFVNQPATKAKTNGVAPVIETDEASVPGEDEGEESPSDSKSKRSPISASERHARNGTMDRNFKFPPPSPPAEDVPPVPPIPSSVSQTQTKPLSAGSGDADSGYGEEEQTVEDRGKGEGAKAGPLSPVSAAPMEVPPPDPVEKEKERVDLGEADDDIGATEEISLN